MATLEPKTHRLKSGDDLVLRSAVPDDAAAILEYLPLLLSESPFFLQEPDEFGMTLQDERDWIQKQRDQPGSLLILAEVDRVIIGSLGCEQGGKRRVAHTTTLGIGVRERWRGKGIGTAMMQASIDWAKTNPSVEKVCLSVFSTNARAVAMYRRLGFVEEGRAKRAFKFAPGTYADKLQMAVFV